MIKEQFYRNCLTSEGREENKNIFRPLTMETYYKNTQIDINDMRNWNQIVYLSKYGNQITWEAFIDGETIEKPVKNEKGEVVGTTKEIAPDETYGQILDQDKWEIYNMWDILQEIINIYENPLLKRPKKDIAEYIEWAKNTYNNLKGESVYYTFLNLYNIM